MRTLRVVHQLVSAGWKVTVLTSDPDHFLPGTPVDARLLTQVPPGVTVLRAGPLRMWDAATGRIKRTVGVNGPDTGSAAISNAGPAGRRRGPLRMVAAVKDMVDAALSIPDRELGWLLPAISKGVRHRLSADPPDVVYSSAPPWTGQLVALGVSAMLRRPWVADFRDPWSRGPWRGDRYRFALRVAGLMERWVVKRADCIVFVADANRAEFASQYRPRSLPNFNGSPTDATRQSSMAYARIPSRSIRRTSCFTPALSMPAGPQSLFSGPLRTPSAPDDSIDVISGCDFSV